MSCLNKDIEIAAVWVQAIGTIIAASGNSAIHFLREEDISNIDLVGNVLQGVGNAVQADQQEKITFEKIGAQIQAIGNTVVATSYIIFEDEIESRLIIKGNWLQAFGALVEAVDEYFDNSGEDQKLNIIGNVIQIIGNSFQAIGGKHILYNNQEKGTFLVISGSWIQAIGSVLNAIGQTQEEIAEHAQKDQGYSHSFYERENKRITLEKRGYGRRDG